MGQSLRPNSDVMWFSFFLFSYQWLLLDCKLVCLCVLLSCLYKCSIFFPISLKLYKIKISGVFVPSHWSLWHDNMKLCLSWHHWCTFFCLIDYFSSSCFLVGTLYVCELWSFNTFIPSVGNAYSSSKISTFLHWMVKQRPYESRILWVHVPHTIQNLSRSFFNVCCPCT